MSLFCLRNSSSWEIACAQSCPTLCDPTDWSPKGSSVYGVSQARILEDISYKWKHIFVYPFIGWWILSCLHFLDTKNAAVKICVQLFVWICYSLGYILAQLVKNLPTMQETPV